MYVTVCGRVRGALKPLHIFLYLYFSLVVCWLHFSNYYGWITSNNKKTPPSPQKQTNKKTTKQQKTNTATTEFKIQVAVKCKDGDGVILCVWLVIQDNNNEILKESHQDSHHHFQFQAADIIRPNSPSSPKTPAHPFVFVFFSQSVARPTAWLIETRFMLEAREGVSSKPNIETPA